MRNRQRLPNNILLILILYCYSCSRPQSDYNDWKYYGGTTENIHYSTLKEIDTNNVTGLQPVWTYHTGDLDQSNSQMQVNPIVINDVLFGVSPKLKLIAINAGTGKLQWSFDPFDTTIALQKRPSGFGINACRGVTYYADGDSNKRIFYTAGSLMYCIDAVTGKPVNSFGQQGTIDLHNDLGRDVSQLYVTSTTPGVIYRDMIIISTRVAEDAAAAPGHIRAYDVYSGKLKWIFHTIPYPGEPGYETWEDSEAYKHIGGANAWSGLTLDKQRGIVFAPIGSASFDFYGGKRLGQNLYANSVLALEAATGKRIWHFQTVHHDVWDRDPPTAPALVTIQKDGNIINAVVQVTKSGFIFLLDRYSGQPVFPVEEKQVPVNTDLVGEKLSPTQPFPTVFSPFVRQVLTEKDLNNLVPDSSYQDIKKRLASFNTGNMFNPPSKNGTIIFPGFDGGAEWGGPSFDPSTGILYINASEMPWVLTMIPIQKSIKNAAEKISYGMEGKNIYSANCMSCHGTVRQGGGNYPAILNANKKYTYDQFYDLLKNGRRMMPSFKQLSNEEKESLASFILNDTVSQKKVASVKPSKPDPYLDLPYATTGYNKFLTKEGYPAVMPPWGTLTAVDLKNGKVIWKDTLGDYPEFKAKGIHTGTENYGGSVVTAGGLLFIAATKDEKLRAFNKATGKLLWEFKLPTAAFATPSVYQVNGKEFLVVACGGGKLGTKSGDAYIAFSLKK
ncbi:MAG: hypothetical protein NVSMB45_14140 [Ginsengibacter sp.]